MLISNENLINLPVYTRSGRHLGKVQGFEIDADSQSIVRYYVKSDSFIEHIIHNKQLIIHSSQVLEITHERLIVDDNTALEPLKFKKEKLPAQQQAVAVMNNQG